MNITLRPRLFEFTKQCKNTPRWPVKSPSHLRTRTQVNLAKLKFCLEYDEQVNYKKPALNQTNSICFAVDPEKKSSSLPVCEIKEMSLQKNFLKHRKFFVKNIKNEYFNTEKLRFVSSRHSNRKNLKNTYVNSRIHSLRSEFNDILVSPHNNRGKSGRNFKVYNKLNKVSRKNASSVVLNVKNPEGPSLGVQNCACVQTDELESSEIDLL